MTEQNLNSSGASNRRRFLKGGMLAGVGATAFALANPFEGLVDAEVEESGEIVKLLSPDGDIIEVDQVYLKPVPDIPKGDERVGMKGRKFVMVIDLSKCKNLKKCQAACNKMHHVKADINWLKVYAMQDNGNSAPYWQPTTCMHCDEPACVKVCPVDATFKRQDGIVLIDNERCIGCRFCMAACPYSTRVFNWGEPEPVSNSDITYSAETSIPAQCGTVEKCDFCPDMLRQSKLPHCVTACPNGVFYFGDKNEDTVTNGDETVRFSELIKDKAGYRLMEELGTKPNVYYLPPVDRIFPFEEGFGNDARQ